MDSCQRLTALCVVTAVGVCIGFLGAMPCYCCCPNPYKPVSQGNVGLVTRFGRYNRSLDPGLVKINPLSERLVVVNTKLQVVGTSDFPISYPQPQLICESEIPKDICVTK